MHPALSSEMLEDIAYAFSHREPATMGATYAGPISPLRRAEVPGEGWQARDQRAQRLDGRIQDDAGESPPTIT